MATGVARDRIRPNSVTSIIEGRAPKHGGSHELNEAIAMPDYAGAMDVHLMPGNYQGGLETALRRALCMTTGSMFFPLA